MKKHIVTIMALMALVTVGAGAQTPEAQDVKSMLRLVADWERANHLRKRITLHPKRTVLPFRNPTLSTINPLRDIPYAELRSGTVSLIVKT